MRVGSRYASIALGFLHSSQSSLSSLLSFSQSKSKVMIHHENHHRGARPSNLSPLAPPFHYQFQGSANAFNRGASVSNKSSILFIENLNLTLRDDDGLVSESRENTRVSPSDLNSSHAHIQPFEPLITYDKSVAQHDLTMSFHPSTANTPSLQTLASPTTAFMVEKNVNEGIKQNVIPYCPFGSNFRDFHVRGKEVYGYKPLTCNDVVKDDMYDIDSYSGEMAESFRTNISGCSTSHLPVVNFDKQLHRPNFFDSFTVNSVSLIQTAAVDGPGVQTNDTYDQLYQIEDSPCWKGASASHISPFAVIETEHSQVVNKGGDSVSSTHNRRMHENTDDFPSLDSVDYPGDSGSRWVEEPPSHKRVSLKVRTHSRVEDSDGVRESANEYFVPDKSTSSSELKSSQTVHPSYVGDVVPSQKGLAWDGRLLLDQVDAIHTDMNSKKQSSFSPPSGVGDCNKPADTFNEAPTSRVIISAIHSLSELLLSTCSIDSWSEQEHDVVQQAIKNLDACVLKKVAKVDAKNVKAQIENQIGLEKKRDARISYTSEDELRKSVPMHNCITINQDDRATKDIKKVLSANFEDDEDPNQHPRIQLYKNLWLESEAELCSVKCKYRFAHLKEVMNRSNLQKEKVVEGTHINVSQDTEKLCSTKVSGNISVPKINENTSILIGDIRNKSSVTAILNKCQVTNSSSTSSKGRQSPPYLISTCGIINEKATHPYLVGDSLNAQAYMQGKEFGSWIRGNGGSSSFDWEHVMKEDIMWRND